MAISIQDLGITQEELISRVVDQLCESTLTRTRMDDEGNEHSVPSEFHRQIKELIKQRIDTKINELAEIHILPKVSMLVENITLQETTRWGEKTGDPVSFIEYLTKRAESYIREEVDYQGKTKAEVGYGWSKSQTRITYLVNGHLHYSIDAAMKQALKDVNSELLKGIAETVKIKLEEASKKLKLSATI